MINHRKIVLVGAGAVGTSFLYSAINQGIAQVYGIIDVNDQLAQGQAMDLEDALSVVPSPAVKIIFGGYELVSDADIVVITAGRPQKDGETRLEMVLDNAKIITTIAKEIKNNGFKGITIIASNPVDIITTIYQKVTNFSDTKVISSSCSLDTSRLKIELSKFFNVSPHCINTFVVGEHGDSSVSAFSYATINGIPISNEMYEKVGLNSLALEQMHKRVYRKAYEIITRKKATHYGIGATLADIVKSIVNDERRIFATGALLKGEYGFEGVYAGIPCVIGKNGIERTYEFPLCKKEQSQLKKSIDILKEITFNTLEKL